MRGDDDVIRLDGVTKTYQAGAPPALDDLSLGVAWSWAARVLPATALPAE